VPRAKSGMRDVAEAAEWRLLGLLLQRPRSGWREEVAALGREVADRRLAAAAVAAETADEGFYLALLGPGGLVSPRAVSYQAFADPGGILSEIAGYHEAFAFRPRVEDPPDHVGVLCDFVGYLRFKEAYARARGESEAAQLAAEARRHVVETHLAPIACALADIFAAAPPSYLRDTVRLLRARVPFVAPQLLGPGAEDEAECGACTAPR
jgi:hypothetical protein